MARQEVSELEDRVFKVIEDQTSRIKTLAQLMSEGQGH